ncbi:MAG: response regulator transcription factor [Acidobacteria bacterium]|nr:response regulator transcription factor [Acidobacteriota bacterium]
MQASPKSVAPIRLYLIDDHALFREGLVALLSQQPDFQVAGTADSVAHGLEAVLAAKPDLVLLDVDLGSERAIDFLYAARQAGVTARVLVVTAGISDAEAVALIREGVAGIFHKHSAPQELCAVVRKVADGDVCLEPRYLKGLFQSVDRNSTKTTPTLSDRELVVVRFLLRGLANKEIGDRIGLSESSVKSVLRGLFDKLGVRTRSQLVKIALEQYSALL